MLSKKIKLEELKELIKCEYCNELFTNKTQPILLPCQNTICNNHINDILSQSTFDHFKCPLCNCDHKLPKNNQFPIDKKAQKLIECEINKLDFGFKHKAVSDELNNLNKLISDFESMRCNLDDYIEENFRKLKNIINFRKEGLIFQIEEDSNKVMEELNGYETSLKEQAKSNELFKLKNLNDFKVYSSKLMFEFNQNLIDEDKYYQLLMETKYIVTKLNNAYDEYLKSVLNNRKFSISNMECNYTHLGELIVDEFETANSLQFLHETSWLDRVKKFEFSSQDFFENEHFNQYEVIRNLDAFLNRELKIGEKCYLVDSNWFNQWIDYYSKTSLEKPGRINISELLENGELKPNLVEGLHYELVCEDLWKYLSKEYKQNGAIERYVISDDENSCRVEKKLLKIKYYYNKNGEKFFFASRITTTQILVEIILKREKALPIGKKYSFKLKLRNLEGTYYSEVEISDKITLESLSYVEHQVLILTSDIFNETD